MLDLEVKEDNEKRVFLQIGDLTFLAMDSTDHLTLNGYVVRCEEVLDYITGFHIPCYNLLDVIQALYVRKKENSRKLHALIVPNESFLSN